MMEVSRLSRFLSSCLLDAELLGQATPGLNKDASLDPDAGSEGAAGQSLVRAVRRDFLIWEPLLNEVVVSWQQNSLTDFDRALTALRDVVTLPESERRAYQVPPGYPIRPRGRARLKVASFDPALRPLRTKSMFGVRSAQLERRIEELGYLLAGVAGELEEDMRHFISMVRRNHFMLANEPSFWDTHRPGLPLVRGRPTSHPFLNDPIDFFKKAVLFHNRTYTVAGGGIDMAYLQVNQLTRYYKFNSPAGSRVIRQHIALCQKRWEENRWDAFTEELLSLAERLRAGPPAGGT
jgi:hypothetical protein